MKKYIDRLIEEWKQHGKIIIAVDFDDTISPWRLADKEECQRVIDLLIMCKAVGAYIVIFTACNKDRYKEIEDYCSSKGLRFDTINQNPIELPYGNQNKIYANIFLDDRAGLHESMEILSTALHSIKGSKLKNIQHIGEIA